MGPSTSLCWVQAVQHRSLCHVLGSVFQAVGWEQCLTTRSLVQVVSPRGPV